MALESLLVPTELVAHEAYAHLSTPMPWRFLQEMPAQGDEWAARLVAELVQRCGERLPALWKLRLTPTEAPALERWLPSGAVRLGDLLRHPEALDTALEALALFMVRGGQSFLTARPDLVLAPGDELLLAGQPEARWALDTTRSWTPPRSTSFTAERRPVGWLWRGLSRGP